ncbi:hypothetical protein PO124_34220 [Bacillus licheniformis]|nr:hypothetical protein [Bacillus licheniformis]
MFEAVVGCLAIRRKLLASLFCVQCCCDQSTLILPCFDISLESRHSYSWYT